MDSGIDGKGIYRIAVGDAASFGRFGGLLGRFEIVVIGSDMELSSIELNVNADILRESFLIITDDTSLDIADAYIKE